VLGKAELTVWDAAHPAPPAADPDFERGLLRWFDRDASAQLRTDLAAGGTLLAAGWRCLARARPSGPVALLEPSTQWRSTHFEIKGTLRNALGEEVLVEWLHPVNATGAAVVWLTGAGKAGLRDGKRQLLPAVQELIDAGIAVIGADLYLQGGEAVTQTRKVKEPREVAAYTLGYNESLPVQRAHDVRTLCDFVRQPTLGDGLPTLGGSLKVAAWGSAAPAAALAALDLGTTPLALDTEGFRFASLTDFRHPDFLPGAVKYLDLPGLLAALPSDLPLWIAGEDAGPRAAKEGKRVYFGDTDQTKQAAAVAWLRR
jgi:hypothetical protein